MMLGHPSVEQSWSTRDLLFHVSPCAKSMPLAAFMDIHRCLHFRDDLEEGVNADWEDVYLDEKIESSATARHRVKVGMVEDNFNKRWKELVTYGLNITFDKSRVAGWFKSSITTGRSFN